MLLLTKKEGLLTCMLISRSFLEDNNLKKVIVPTPSFLEDGTAFYETLDEMEKVVLCVSKTFTAFTVCCYLMLTCCCSYRQAGGGKGEEEGE
uniref:Aminotran_1_2 domain-containing protein n=1 Tax=Ascaris lumbricoides TaxID=6252 RepID=A0A0M3HKA9_ASCLU